MTTNLPALPSLEHLRRQSKDLVTAFRKGDADAIRRVHAHLPRAAALDAGTITDQGLKLSEAQLIIARDHGFASWPRLKRHVEELQPDDAAATEAFKRAVEKGDSARARTLLRTQAAVRAQVNAPLFSFDSPAILAAASRQDRKMVEVLLEYGADMNARSQWWAGGFGVLPQSDPEFGAYLIERGADVDIWAAAGMNRLDRLAELITADPALVNVRGGDGQGPLHFAASVEGARLLLDHGADIDMRDLDHAGTPAQYMAADRPEVCRYLLSRGAELDIFMAVQLGDLDLVRRAMEEDPDALRARVGAGKFTSGTSDGGHIYIYTLTSGASPLMVAAHGGNEAVYQYLLEKAIPSEQLLAACLRADEAAVQGMLAARPGLLASLTPEQKGMIAAAAWAHMTASVRVMLDAGFDIEARGDDDSTPLNRAAVRGFADLIDLLLARGASLEARNAFGGRPLGACLWGAENFRDRDGDYARSVELLLQAGAPLSDVRYPIQDRTVTAVLRKHLDRLARTNLIAAIKLGRADRVISLLDHDPSLAKRLTDGILPLYEAVRSNQPEILRTLAARGADPGLRETEHGPTLSEAAARVGSPEISAAVSELSA